jgi:hypothetical protein
MSLFTSLSLLLDFSNELMIEWGCVTTETDTIVFFPISYQYVCYSVTISSTASYTIRISQRTPRSFVIGNIQMIENIDWVAVGF